MRIIRTPAAGRAGTEKGWVREGILRELSKEPSTLTDLAKALGVSKSTVSYHLSSLLGRGAVEMVQSARGRGGVVVKRYALSQGSLVLLPNRGAEEDELRHLREVFDVQVLGWGALPGGPGLEEFTALLYQMFLQMFKITRTEHRALMEEYGARAGGIVSGKIREGTLRETVLNLVGYLRERSISDADLVDFQNSQGLVFVSNVCIGSEGHPVNSCYFLEGILRGALTTKIGPQVKVQRVEVPGLSSCYLAVGSGRSLDVAKVAELVLTSPRYSALNRGKRGS